MILASKPGQYRTEPGEGVQPVEAWDYADGGKVRARFVIARMEGERRIRVVDEAEPPAISNLPTKFLDKYDSVEAARAALEDLAGHGGGRAVLTRAA